MKNGAPWRRFVSTKTALREAPFLSLRVFLQTSRLEAGHCRRRVLIRIRPADADCADDLAAGHDRNSALDRRRSREAEQRDSSLGDSVLERLGRAAEHGSRLGLVERDVDARGLRVVHALVV